MPLSLTGLTLMLAGPSDTGGDVSVVNEVIHRWNDEHARKQGVVFLPVHYTRNVVPVYQQGVDGQVIINEQITNDSDLAICLFRHRLGSPTPRNDLSASVEEADVVSARGRAYILFWDGDIPRTVVTDQKADNENKRLNAFRKSFESITDPRGLYGTYSSDDDLRQAVEQILWEHAHKHPAQAATKSRSDVDLVVQVRGPVWRVPRIADVIDKVAASTTRTMSEEAAQRYTADCHGRADELQKAIAANAGSPIAVDVRTTDAKITDLEIEIEFSKTLGVDPANETWGDVWRIPRPKASLHSTAVSIRGVDTTIQTIHLRGTMPTWPNRASWTDIDRDDVLLTVTIEYLRRSRVATHVEDEVVLWLVSDDDATAVDYTWHASGTVGLEVVEWSGTGTVDVISEVQALQQLQGWREGRTN